MTPLRKTILGILSLLTVVPAVAHASGSMSVTVVSKRHSLTVKQTFRKILASGQAKGYGDSVRKDFLAIHARLTPRLDALLEKEAGRTFRGILGTYELPCPTTAKVILKRRKVKYVRSQTFPALVQLMPIPSRDRRLVFFVRLPLSKRPAPGRLLKLHARIRKLITAHARSKVKGKGEAVQLAPIVDKGARLRVEVRPRFWVAREQAPRLQGQLAALAKKLRPALEARVKKASGVSLALLKPGLKRYADTRRLPGLASAHRSGPQLHVMAVYALARIEKPEQLEALRRTIYQEITRTIPAPM